MFARRLLRGRVLAIALPAAIVTVGVSVVAVAAIPGGDGKISGCYEPRTGLLRVIDAEAGRTCTRFETAISWNQTGPKGDTGAPGAAGPKGDTGAAGADGAPGAKGDKGDTGAAGNDGAPGAQGEKGDTGAQGETGAAGATNIALRRTVGTAPGATTAVCDPGEKATGGGAEGTNPNLAFTIASSRPLADGTGTAVAWTARMQSNAPVTVWVLCAAP